MSKSTSAGGRERRLAAIMFTDLVGYTSLSQRNEPLALALLEEHKELLRPIFAQFKGSEIKTIGDSFLVEFVSALDALNCAFEIQRSLHDLNSGRPAGRIIMLRIGIHLGDVIHDKGDVFGDAVNIASRIQPLAMPGGICITQQVFDQVQNKFESPIVPLGKQELKNVELPVGIYAVALPWERVSRKQLESVTPGIQQERTGQVTDKASGERTPKVSSGVEALDEILEGGYPEKSSIMVGGPPGIGKEALGYWFIHSGLVQSDYCLYVTHRRDEDVLKDMRAFGIPTDKVPGFMTGPKRRADLNDPNSIASEIKMRVQEIKTRRIRIVTDILSPLLVLNSSESMYRYWTELASELKNYDVVLIALVEEGMHQPSVFASMEQLFDGVIELRIYEQGLLLTPLLRVKKMLGLPPLHGYFKFTFARARMEIVTNVIR